MIDHICRFSAVAEASLWRSLVSLGNDCTLRFYVPLHPTTGTEPYAKQTLKKLGLEGEVGEVAEGSL